MNCNICPRQCNVDRSRVKGFCRESDTVRISKVMFHKFEEPIISGTGKGSGAVFFTGCNLRCVFCQNYPISNQGKGKRISIKHLAKIFKRLEKKGASNINLVTPTHFSTEIMKALDTYRPKIPIVWNSNGYESEETINKLKDYVDIFLVDLKYFSDDLAVKYSRANNYFYFASKAVKLMRKLQPQDIISNGLMEKGVIIRHLILPTHTDDSLHVLDFIANEIGDKTIVSIMSQYEPMYDAKNHPEINRKITPLEYKRVVNHALKLNMTNCYTQELSSADTKYTPKF